jgi:hypothetical protein
MRRFNESILKQVVESTWIDRKCQGIKIPVYLEQRQPYFAPTDVWIRKVLKTREPFTYPELAIELCESLDAHINSNVTGDSISFFERTEGTSILHNNEIITRERYIESCFIPVDGKWWKEVIAEVKVRVIPSYRLRGFPMSHIGSPLNRMIRSVYTIGQGSVNYTG